MPPILQKGPRAFAEILSIKEVKLNNVAGVKHRDCSWHLSAARGSVTALLQQAWRCLGDSWHVSSPPAWLSDLLSSPPHVATAQRFGSQSSAHITSPPQHSPALTVRARGAGRVSPWTGGSQVMQGSISISLPADRSAAASPRAPEKRTERNHRSKAGSSTASVLVITAKKGPCVPQTVAVCVPGSGSDAPGEGTALPRRWRFVSSGALAHISSLVSHPRSPKSACQGRSTKPLTQGEKASSCKTFIC